MARRFEKTESENFISVSYESDSGTKLDIRTRGLSDDEPMCRVIRELADQLHESGLREQRVAGPQKADQPGLLPRRVAILVDGSGSMASAYSSGRLSRSLAELEAGLAVEGEQQLVAGAVFTTGVQWVQRPSVPTKWTSLGYVVRTLQRRTCLGGGTDVQRAVELARHELISTTDADARNRPLLVVITDEAAVLRMAAPGDGKCDLAVALV